MGCLMRKPSRTRLAVLAAMMITVTALSARLRADTGMCRGASVTIPFTDVAGSNIFFCSIAAAYFSGLTNGTTPTTYNPTDLVLRDQMSAFVTRTLDQSLRRGSRRAALGQWWTPKIAEAVRATDVGTAPQFVVADGEHILVSNTAGTLQLVEASSGNLISTTGFGLINLRGILVAGSLIWTVGYRPAPYDQYEILVTTHGSNGGTFLVAGNNPIGLTFDGEYIWIANFGTSPNTGSLTRLRVSLTSPANTFTAGFNQPYGILYDGASLWN
jgi:hypothetical protein